jgi:hypothetical protein
MLFSGGTDSTCAAALLAEEFDEIHLLTFYERGTRNSHIPTANKILLEKKFPHISFIQKVLSTDALVERISYYNYWGTIRRHGFFVLATPGFSSLSWHTTMIAYCQKHAIFVVADGLTRELLHFPGHMDKVIALFREQYSNFGIEYRNPVRDWEVPPDQQVLDRLIVDRHGFFVEPDGTARVRKKTTGEYLYAAGIFPSPNIKGSQLDQVTQHDCYPFVLYNVFAFWMYLPFHSIEEFENRIEKIMREKTNLCTAWLRSNQVRLTA